MKILFLGTGAADWPKEKSADSEEFRRNSSVLIDDTLLIDPGPQVISALKEYGRDAKKIKYIINTHKHADHFCQEALDKLRELGAEFIELSENETQKIGKYTVSAYGANHSCENTVHFIITDGDKTLFYGLDGAWLMYDEITAIKKVKPDFAVIEATIGEKDGDYRIFEHNNLNMVLEMKKSLEPFITQWCISHMARTLHTSHQELESRMKPHNILVAFDGMEAEI